MPETTASATRDHRPVIVICAYEPAESGWDPIEDLSGEPWSPNGARTLVVPADDPQTLATTLSGHLRDPDCRGLLLVGRTQRGGDFRIQIRAENLTLDGTRRMDAIGPGLARATAPGADMVRALTGSGLTAAVSSDAEPDAGSYLLYQVLARLPEGGDAPAVGLLRAPEQAADPDVQRAVKAAAQAMASHFSPLPRMRAG